jgi:hypothetical protein
MYIMGPSTSVQDLDNESFRFSELRSPPSRRGQSDIDEKMLFDTLEGATNLHEAIAAVIHSTLDDEALAKALRAAAALSVELLRKRQESS